jgi:hypothetical protein
VMRRSEWADATDETRDGASCCLSCGGMEPAMRWADDGQGGTVREMTGGHRSYCEWVAAMGEA